MAPSPETLAVVGGYYVVYCMRGDRDLQLGGVLSGPRQFAFLPNRTLASLNRHR